MAHNRTQHQALTTPAILSRVLSFAEDPRALILTSKSIHSVATATHADWHVNWILCHPTHMLTWATQVVSEFRAPSTKFEWLELVGKSPLKQRSLVCRFVSNAEDTIERVVAVVYAHATSVRVANTNTFAPPTTHDGATDSSTVDGMSQLKTVRQALWLSASRHLRTKTITTILDNEHTSRVDAKIGISTWSMDFIKPAVFAALHGTEPGNTHLLNRLLSLITTQHHQSPSVVLPDLHNFAVRLGRLDCLKILVEHHNYVLGQRIVAMLNHAYQHHDTDMVDYLLSFESPDKDVKESMQLWRMIMQLQKMPISVDTDTEMTRVGDQILVTLTNQMKKSAPKRELVRAHWTALLEMACGMGLLKLVRGLLDMAETPEYAVFELRVSVKMLALAVDGGFFEIAEAIIDSNPIESETNAAGTVSSKPIQGRTSTTDSTTTSTSTTTPVITIAGRAMMAQEAAEYSVTDKIETDFLKNLPRNPARRREELLYRYCSTSDNDMFAALFPHYHLTELSLWMESIKVHRIDAITFLIGSGSALEADGFRIPEECIWGAFQAGHVEIAEILKEAGGSFGWMESMTNNPAAIEEEVVENKRGTRSRGDGKTLSAKGASRQGTAGKTRPEVSGDKLDGQEEQTATDFDDDDDDDLDRSNASDITSGGNSVPASALAVFGAYAGATDVNAKMFGASGIKGIARSPIDSPLLSPSPSIENSASVSADSVQVDASGMNQTGGSKQRADTPEMPSSARRKKSANGRTVHLGEIRDLLRASEEKRQGSARSPVDGDAKTTAPYLDSIERLAAAVRTPLGQRSSRTGSASSSDGAMGASTRSRNGSSLLSRIVRGGLVQAAEDQAWSDFLAGRIGVSGSGSSGPSGNALAWMEPRSAGAPAMGLRSATASVAPVDVTGPGDALAVYAALGGALY